MSASIYANFVDAHQAEKALGALLDRGANSVDLTAFFPPDYFANKDPLISAVEKATHGITTTTGGDAALGGVKGAGLGLGIGALAALASLMIPGFGLVTGGSALITALAGVAGTTAGGALAGGFAGFLQDQGVSQRIALDSEEAWQNGRALIIVHCPTGELNEVEVRDLLHKYHAVDYGRHETPMATKA